MSQQEDIWRLHAMDQALRHSNDFYAAEEMRSLPRHIGVTVFFISIAISLNVGTSFVIAALVWFVLRIMRNALWRSKFHYTNLWTWLLLVRAMLYRWIIAILCIVVFWWRTPQGFQYNWIWLSIVLLLDVAVTLFVEGRGYAKAKLSITELEVERARIQGQSRR